MDVEHGGIGDGRLRLQVIISSTRPGRVGLPVAQWFCERVEEDGAFELDVADLAEINLPFMDEPNHPRLRQYQHQHTLDWSARVDAADAFVIVTPEYNYGFSAPLKNAIDYLHHEWHYKPVGFVSYFPRIKADLMTRLAVLGEVVPRSDAASPVAPSPRSRPARRQGMRGGVIAATVSRS